MNRRLHSVTAPVAEDLAAQDDSLDIQCPLCGAARDAYCTSPITDAHLRNRTSHWQRIKAARTEDT